MNWDALGAIAELLGAIAVFLTLAYLTVQVRQNSKALELQNKFSAAQIMQARTDTVMGFISVLLSSEENVKAQMVASSISDASAMNEQDPSIRVRANSILSGSRSLYENVFFQYKEGFLTDDFYTGLEPNIAVYAESWLTLGTAMSSEFKAEVVRIHEKKKAA